MARVGARPQLVLDDSQEQVLPGAPPVVQDLVQEDFSLDLVGRKQRPATVGRRMTAVLAVLAVVAAAEATGRALAEVPWLPTLQSLLLARPEPTPRLLLVLAEGPREVFHLHQLPVQCTGGVAVAGGEQRGCTRDEGCCGLAEPRQADERVVAVAPGRRPGHAVWADQDAADVQLVARALQSVGERNRQLPPTPTGLRVRRCPRQRRGEGGLA